MPVGSPRARFWARAAARRFHAVICPSRHGRAAQIAYGLPAERVVTIPNSVPVATFAGGDGAVARRALNLPA
jgi:hypothetical protein